MSDLYLNKGDCIGVAAPSSNFNQDAFQEGVRCIQKQGYTLEIPEAIFDRKRYLAGEDRTRADVINQLYANPEVKAIIAARGGYGSMRLLEYLDWDLIEKNPKMVMGFSDVTALLSVLIAHGSVGVHGPNLVSLATASSQTMDAFFSCLAKSPSPMVLSGDTVLVPGRGEGILLGGNLATLSHLCGTPFQPDFRGGILLIEDVGEPAYKIDRMLSQMKMAGMLSDLRGVVLGEFTDCDRGDYIPEIVREIFDGIPILSGILAGHGVDNFPLVMGERVLLDTAKKISQWGGN